MPRTMTYTGELTIVSCTPECGIVFAVPKDLYSQARNVNPGPNGTSITCPLGHSFHYVAKSDAQIEREARAAAEREATRVKAQLDQERARVQMLRRSRSALKGEVTKARKRAARTQCPVADCKRTFAPTNMQRHVETEHPHWHPEPELEPA